MLVGMCCVHAQLLSCVWLFVTSGTIARQALLSMGFSRWGYWNGLPFPSPGDLPGLGGQTCISCSGRRILYYWATCKQITVLGTGFVQTIDFLVHAHFLGLTSGGRALETGCSAESLHGCLLPLPLLLEEAALSVVAPVQRDYQPYLMGIGSRVLRLLVAFAFPSTLGTCSLSTICSGAWTSAAKDAWWQKEADSARKALGIQRPEACSCCAGHLGECHSSTARKERLGQLRVKLWRTWAFSGSLTPLEPASLPSGRKWASGRPNYSEWQDWEPLQIPGCPQPTLASCCPSCLCGRRGMRQAEGLQEWHYIYMIQTWFQ